MASLLKDNTTSHIFCLNRKDEGGAKTKSALLKIIGLESAEFRRLKFLKADLEQPDFGLEATEIAILRDEVDELIFSAWDPNWIKPLDHFHPFLKGVRHSIFFCAAARRRPRITFISSICAVGDWPLVYSSRSSIPKDIVWDNRSAMPHGYGESKCVAEQLLSLGSEKSGLAVNIVRAGQIGGPQNPSMGAWPLQGWLYSIIMTSRRLGYFPDNVQPLDWIPVDYLAHGVAAGAGLKSKRSSVRVFNMVHPQPVPWSMLYHTLKRHYGLSADLVNLSRWLACSNSDEVKLHGFLKATGGGREGNMAFSNENAVRILPLAQPITRELLSTWLESWNLPRDVSRAKI